MSTATTPRSRRGCASTSRCLVRNYRAQFDSIIRRTSFEQLLARMKAAEDKRTGFEVGPTGRLLVAGVSTPSRQ